MKKSILNTIILAFAMTLMACHPQSNLESYKTHNPIDLALIHKNNWEISNDILLHINTYRVEHGKQALIKDSLYACAYAVDHTLYMINTNEVNHHNFFSRSDGLKTKGATDVAENIAYGYSSAKTVVRAWIKSQTHRAVIEGDYTHVGFGVIKSNSDQRYYFTTLFYK